MLKNIAAIILVLFLISPVSARAEITLADYYQAGNRFYAQGKYPLSIRCYKAVIADDPQNWKPYQALGSCECNLAILDYKKSLAINFNNPVLQNFLNEVSAVSGTSQTGPSPISNQSGVSATPAQLKSLEDNYRAGGEFYAQGNYDSSISCYEAVIEIDPQNWKAYQALGSCECLMAERDYKKSLEINPNNPVLQSFIKVVSGDSTDHSTTAATVQMAGATVVPTAIAATAPVVAATPKTTPTAGLSAAPPSVQEDSRLPRQGSLTWEIGSALGFYDFQDLISDYAPATLTTPFQTPIEVELDLGADYTITQNFQLGAQFQYLAKQPEIIYQTSGPPSAVSTTTTWTESCAGGELEGKYLLPLNNKFRLIFEGQAGFYTLVDTTYVNEAASLQTLDLNGSSLGELIGAELEWIPDQGGWALDFGLSYRFLTFGSITYTSTGYAPSQNLTNNSGGNATINFSGPRVSVTARFF